MRAARASEAESNALSVRLELQADCFAGVWATRSQQEQGWRLEPGDLETALHAAAQIGDDTLSVRRAAPSFPSRSRTAPARSASPGSKRGVDGGKLDSCNTFAAEAL